MDGINIFFLADAKSKFYISVEKRDLFINF